MVYQGTSQFNITISGNMINPNSEIVFMPLHRSIKQSIGGGKSSNAAPARASNKSSVAQVEKAIDAGGTTLVKIVQPKAKPKLSKKEAKKAEEKKALDAKNEKAKKEAAAKKDSKKIESKLPVKNENVQSKVDKPESKVEEATQPTRANTNNAISDSSSAPVGALDNLVYVGQAEMDALQAQDYIQHELAQHWAPPSGMRADLFAIVTLTIDFEGVIKKVDLATSSGNLLFDTAAKKASAQITPARWTFGKELSITFKP